MDEDVVCVDYSDDDIEAPHQPRNERKRVDDIEDISDDDEDFTIKYPCKRKKIDEEKEKEEDEEELPSISTLYPSVFPPSMRGITIYTVELVIDSRERRHTEILQYFSDKNIKTSVKALSIGDYMVLINGRAVSVAERKRQDDMYNSMLSHRYRDQKNRLLSSGIPIVRYITSESGSEEKDASLLKDRLRRVLPKNVNWDAVDNTFRDFRVIEKFKRFDRETKRFRYRTEEERQSFIDSIVSNQAIAMVSDDCLPQYLHALVRISKTYAKEKEIDLSKLSTLEQIQLQCGKKSITTSSDFFGNTLQSIKGMSAKKAEAIVNIYKTIPKLLEAYSKCKNEKESELLLNKATNKIITIPLSATIYKFITGK